ncbi:AAA family ATPase [Streptomyces sp. NPDC057798]|uniref:helix-turn-helix transcriptional regulator n=1 Tax=Streptomyces sp. NPDC057798 TaxID=3346252 RepID=UPI0036B6FDD1
MDLIQRDAQFDRLRRAFENCTEQHDGQVCLISGGVGSGKTTLLEAFARHVTGRSAQLLSAVGSRAERNLQFAVMDQLIDSSGLSRASMRQLATAVRHLALPTAPAPPGDTTARPAGTSATLMTGTAGTAGTAVKAAAPYPPRLVPGPEQPPPSPVSGVHGTFASLLDLARPAPLVITVDDVHHADQASLQCLLYAVRRLRHRRIMVVLTESSTLCDPHPYFRAELMSRPYFSRIDLAPLTDEALGLLAETHPLPSARARIARRAPELTGGSPLLMRAFLDDPAATGNAPQPAAPVPGVAAPDPVVGGSDGPLAQAVLRSLYRHDPEVRATAQALAVLDRPTPLPVLARLLSLTPDLTAQALQLLGRSGLVDGDRVRRPLVTAVLADLPAEDRRRLHRRAAEVLHEFGAEPEVLAGHLISAEWAEPDWAEPALLRAAAQALDSGRPDITSACLRLSRRRGPDTPWWTTSDSLLLRSRWQLNPLSATTHLGTLATADRSGDCPPAALAGVPALLWQGRSETACSIVTAVAALPDPTPETGTRLATARLLISLFRPDHCRQARTEARAITDSGIATSVNGRHLDALMLLAGTLFTGEATGDAAASAELMIQRHLDDDGALGLLSALLLAMVYAGRPAPVREWTRMLLARPSVGHVPSWKAVLHAIRAEAALRLGCPEEAEDQARAALTVITPQAWGVAVVAPLGTLVAAATEAGRLEDADRWLARPVPAESFRTPLGLHYLASRARYQLAVGSRRSAADDLRWIRREMAAWRMDSAALVPWRLDLARVHIARGQRQEAVRLLREQLEPARSADERTRGSALRLLAGLLPPEQGAPLLARAVALLESCGDRRELARAHADRARAPRRRTAPDPTGRAAPPPVRRSHSRTPTEVTYYQHTARPAHPEQQETRERPVRPERLEGGERPVHPEHQEGRERPARPERQQAQQRAEHQDGRERPVRPEPPGAQNRALRQDGREQPIRPGRPERPGRPHRPEPVGGLSEAESRVAALAAQGHTNRQISSKLFITVSTVEQHLTRIYRKLNVKHRRDLATRLAAAGAVGN